MKSTDIYIRPWLLTVILLVSVLFGALVKEGIDQQRAQNLQEKNLRKSVESADKPSPTPSPTPRRIDWANATVQDQALRTVELGLRDDHIVVWRVPVMATPTPAPPPPEATSQP